MCADIVTELPTKAVSFYTVEKPGKCWAVVLVTPVEGLRPLKTALASSPDRNTAIEYGRETATRLLRPFKKPKEGHMPQKEESPAAAGTAHGAGIEKRDDPDDARSSREAQGARGTFQSLKWCRAVLDVMAAYRTADATDRPTFLVAAVAMDWACFADKEALLFRSDEDTADAVGADASKVREARNWIIRRGLAEKPDGIVKTSGKPRRGRKATTYRLLMISNIRPHEGGKSEAITAPLRAEKDRRITAPKQGGITAPIGAPTVYRTGNGAGARVNAPPAPVQPGGGPGYVVEDDVDDAEQKRAHSALEEPMVASGAITFVSDPIIAAEFRDEVPDVIFGFDPDDGEDRADDAVTLTDLDRLAAEEAAADQDEDGPSPLTVAATSLHSLHSNALDDPDGHVDHVLEGYLADDPDAARQAAITTAKLLLAAGPKDETLEVWRAHYAILSRMLVDYSGSGDRAANAMARFSAAVGDAARARIARRKEINAVAEEAADA